MKGNLHLNLIEKYKDGRGGGFEIAPLIQVF